MIVRGWRGYGAVSEAGAYPRHLLESVRPRLKQLPGFRGLYLLRRRGTEEIEFLIFVDTPGGAPCDPTSDYPVSCSPW